MQGGVRMFTVTVALVLFVFCFTINLTAAQQSIPIGPADCAEVFAQSVDGIVAPSGKYQLRVGTGRRIVWAYCDMTTDGGGWTVIQRRTGPAVDFYRPWADYEMGFGDTESDHWLGNTYIHSLTVSKRYILRIELTDWNYVTYYAEYSNFVVAGAGCRYQLVSVGDVCGDCGDSFTAQLGSNFTTYDRDNDQYAVGSCAILYHGAWWYSGCHFSNLNGRYFVGGNHASYADGMDWRTGKGYYYSYMRTEMKIRPYDF